jgi:hypothetical protein
VYPEKSYEDGQLLIRPLLRKAKDTNMAAGWLLKLTFNFMEKIHEQLHLDKWSSLHWKIMDIPTRSIWIVIFFDGACECDTSKFGGYVGTNTEQRCIEFCNFVQFHIFIRYLSC